jgi:hypothetical protein
VESTRVTTRSPTSRDKRWLWRWYGSWSPARCVHSIDTHVSNPRSVTSVVCCCSFQFHLMPFVPFEVQVICVDWNSNHGRHVPSPYALGPPITDPVRHKIASLMLRALPPSCHHSHSLFLFSTLVLISSDPSLSSIFVRFLCGFPSLSDPDPSQPSYLPTLVWPSECLSERWDSCSRSSRARASSPSNDQVPILFVLEVMPEKLI